MKRWWIVVVLLFSVGINVGILATLAVSRLTRSTEPLREATPIPRSVPPGQEQTEPDRSLSPEPRATPHSPMPQLERMADHLGLEGADRERFLEIQRAFFIQLGLQRNRMQEARRALRQELISESPDRLRAEEYMKRSTEAHAALERALVVNVLDSREILGPAQERRFAILIERISKGAANPAASRPNPQTFRRGDRLMRPEDRFQRRDPNRPEERRRNPRRSPPPGR